MASITVTVAVADFVGSALTYRVPATLAALMQPGVAVLVPLRERKVPAVVLRVGKASEAASGAASEAASRAGVGEGHERAGSLRDVLTVLDDEPLFDEPTFALFYWLCEYYMAAPGMVLRLFLPPGFGSADKPAIRLTAQGRRSAALTGTLSSDAKLTDRVLAVVRDGESLVKQATLLRRLNGQKSATGAFATVTAARVKTALTRLAALGEIELVRVADVSQSALTRKVVGLAHGVTATQAREVALTLATRAPRQHDVLVAVAEQVEREAGAAAGVELAGLEAQIAGARAAVAALEKKALVVVVSREVRRDPHQHRKQLADVLPEPTNDQARVLGAIEAAMDAATGAATGAAKPATMLLHGVTGSGKTEVYLRAAEMALARGRTALILVPEIVLTARLCDLARARFGARVALLHSNLGDGERYDEWRAIREGSRPVVIGARSAVFAPLAEIGLIVVDEEHDAAYKQEDQVRYHGRDTAVMRAAKSGAVCVLGSATPSVESTYNAREGRYALLELPSRVTARAMPPIALVDARKARLKPEAPLSRELIEALNETYLRGEQSIVLLNRRGYHTTLQCRACGHAFECPSCSVSLVEHRAGGQGAATLACHYCGYTTHVPETCPACGSEQVKPYGLGLERLEAILHETVPGARIARLDRDTTRKKGTLHATLDAMREGRLDVLVGTQMVAKGHDFPRVTLVGVVAADIGLQVPDFRAGERLFQLLSQVSGRAGRAELSGRVIVQTWQPEHYALQAAAGHDYEKLYAREVETREPLLYPPFSRLVLVRVEGKKERETEEAARRLHGLIAEAIGAAGARVRAGGRAARWSGVKRPRT